MGERIREPSGDHSTEVSWELATSSLGLPPATGTTPIAWDLFAPASATGFSKTNAICEPSLLHEG